MKRVFILCLLAIGMMAEAQTNQIITKKLQLNNVPAGLSTDKVLVRGLDKVVKEVTMSSGIADAPNDGNDYVRNSGAWSVASFGSSNLQQTLTGGNTATDVGVNLNSSFTSNGISMYYDSDQENYLFKIGNPTSYTKLDNSNIEIVNNNTNNGVVIATDRFAFYNNTGSQHIVAPIGLVGNQSFYFPNAIGSVFPSTLMAIQSTSIPATSTASGNIGEIRIDANYVYYCMAPNTWVRSAVTTW